MPALIPVQPWDGWWRWEDGHPQPGSGMGTLAHLWFGGNQRGVDGWHPQGQFSMFPRGRLAAVPSEQRADIWGSQTCGQTSFNNRMVMGAGKAPWVGAPGLALAGCWGLPRCREERAEALVWVKKKKTSHKTGIGPNPAWNNYVIQARRATQWCIGR